MNAKLKAISERASEDLAALIKEAEQKLLEAWSQAEEQALDDDTKPKFRIGFAITLDLDADNMETKLSWSVRHALSRDGQIPDPDQATMVFSDVDGDKLSPTIGQAMKRVGGAIAEAKKGGAK